MYIVWSSEIEHRRDKLLVKTSVSSQFKRDLGIPQQSLKEISTSEKANEGLRNLGILGSKGEL